MSHLIEMRKSTVSARLTFDTKRIVYAPFTFPSGLRRHARWLKIITLGPHYPSDPLYYMESNS